MWILNSFHWLQINSSLTAQWATVLVTLGVGVAAFWIARMQYKVNNSTEIFAYAVSGINTLFLRVTNVGKIQVYIDNYKLNGTTINMEGALVPIQIQGAWYDIPLGPLTDLASKDIILVMTDELNRKWQSEIKLNYNNGDNGWIATVYKIRRVN